MKFKARSLRSAEFNAPRGAKFKASKGVKFTIIQPRGAVFGVQEPAAEREISMRCGILMAHGILKFKDASAR